MNETPTRRRRRMSAGPDVADDALWEARNQPQPWIVQSMRPNGDVVRLDATLDWTLEAALRRAYTVSPTGAGSLIIAAATTGDETVQIYGRQVWRLWQRLDLKANRSPSEEWADLAEEWRVRHDAVLRFPLHDGGMMKSTFSPRTEALIAAEKAVQVRMDAFMAAHP